jgi:hypothetical protein
MKITELVEWILLGIATVCLISTPVRDAAKFTWHWLLEFLK